MELDGGISTTAPTPSARTPDTGASDSELSDVNEKIVQRGPPEPVQVNRAPTAPAPVVAPKKGKNPAAARATKKMEGSAGRLSGNHAHKLQPPTAEQVLIASVRTGCVFAPFNACNGTGTQAGQAIAGVAFTGGGGSRQLGPDDNDPNLTQSESDDFCSACRGVGELLCCENCPRVFHLLCYDPPRTEVPDGAFYCYECNAKSAAPDDSADSYPSLGPLFNKLERTNPRAFALPPGIQNNFEGVSARPDGSYSEEVKKFPLAKNSGYGYQRPEYTELIDADHKVILCTQCGVSSGNKRQMLKCDFCHAYWHLDCVDP
ncbi:hypothetical protein AA0117_g13207, partial [Alternaria alternata]